MTGSDQSDEKLHAVLDWIENYHLSEGRDERGQTLVRFGLGLACPVWDYRYTARGRAILALNFQQYAPSPDEASAIREWIDLGVGQWNVAENAERLIRMGLLQPNAVGHIKYTWTAYASFRATFVSLRRRYGPLPDSVCIDYLINRTWEKAVSRAWESGYVQTGEGSYTEAGEFRYRASERRLGSDDVIANPLIPEYQNLRLLQRWTHEALGPGDRERLVEQGLCHLSEAHADLQSTAKGARARREMAALDEFCCQWQYAIKPAGVLSELEEQLVARGVGIVSPDGSFWPRDVISAADSRFRFLNR